MKTTFKLKRLAKSAFMILAIALFAAVTGSCSKEVEVESVPLITKITNKDGTATETFSYNAQGKPDRFTYENNKIWWKSDILDGSGQPKYSIAYFIDASHGKISKIDYRNNDFLFQYSLNYDEKGRVTLVDVKQSFESSGFTPFYKSELQWDEQNRLISYREIYPNGEIEKYEFSDFKNFKNTIGYKNLNFKYFGEYGLGQYILGLATPIFNPIFDSALFPGTQVPGKETYTQYKADGTVEYEITKNYFYTLDDKNRIVLRETIGANKIISYEYKD